MDRLLCRHLDVLVVAILAHVCQSSRAGKLHGLVNLIGVLASLSRDLIYDKVMIPRTYSCCLRVAVIPRTANP